jgi:hypothetical protein
VRRAAVVGITWPLPEELADGELERLFTAPGEAQPERPAPNWAKLHEEHEAGTLHDTCNRVNVSSTPSASV